MKGDAHERAEQLILASRVEGISEIDRQWLDSHLETCSRCADQASSLERVVASLRLVPISLEPSLVEATRRRVHLRARELRERDTQRRALWLSCALSWLMGAITAPLFWQGLKWVGQHTNLPDAAWLMVFAVWWVVPAVTVAAVLTWQRSRALEENGYATTKQR